MALRTVQATRYVTPFREGGSLPGLVEADDDGLYVVKFRGAAQGPRALVAEVLAGELARALGLPVPELVLVDVDPRARGVVTRPLGQRAARAEPGRQPWARLPAWLDDLRSRGPMAARHPTSRRTWSGSMLW